MFVKCRAAGGLCHPLAHRILDLSRRRGQGFALASPLTDKEAQLQRACDSEARPPPSGRGEQGFTAPAPHPLSHVPSRTFWGTLWVLGDGSHLAPRRVYPPLPSEEAPAPHFLQTSPCEGWSPVLCFSPLKSLMKGHLFSQGLGSGALLLEGTPRLLGMPWGSAPLCRFPPGVESDMSGHLPGALSRVWLLQNPWPCPLHVEFWGKECAHLREVPSAGGELTCLSFDEQRGVEKLSFDPPKDQMGRSEVLPRCSLR